VSIGDQRMNNIPPDILMQQIKAVRDIPQKNKIRLNNKL
jgi:hypothetical protein